MCGIASANHTTPHGSGLNGTVLFRYQPIISTLNYQYTEVITEYHMGYGAYHFRERLIANDCVGEIMFEKCVTCERIGESCVPNLWLLPFSDLVKWCIKRQKHLGWTNQAWADRSTTPIGTINRIKGGDTDCKYSTIRNLAIALIGGTTDEFACTAQVERELQQMERLEQQAARLSVVEAENEMLKARLAKIDELHRQDIRIIKEEYQAQKAEYQDQIAFLKEELKAWRMWHQTK